MDEKRLMTWREFKEIVDDEIMKQGKTEDCEIGEIDLSFPRYINVDASGGKLFVYAL
jgi:hypothetical protein